MGFASDILRFILCIAILCFIAYGLSTNRKAINWPLIGKAILLQIFIAIIAFKLSWFAAFFAFVAKLFVKVYSFSLEGSSFIFGPLENIESNGWIFAIQVLPSLIFFSALFSLLYYLRVLPFIINSLSWLMRKTLKNKRSRKFSSRWKCISRAI